MNTIYELYTCGGLTRETVGERGRNVARSGGDADFFAQAKIIFWGEVRKVLAHARSVTPNAAALFLPSRKKQGAKKWTH